MSRWMLACMGVADLGPELWPVPGPAAARGPQPMLRRVPGVAQAHPGAPQARLSLPAVVAFSCNSIMHHYGLLGSVSLQPAACMLQLSAVMRKPFGLRGHDVFIPGFPIPCMPCLKKHALSCQMRRCMLPCTGPSMCTCATGSWAPSWTGPPVAASSSTHGPSSLASPRCVIQGSPFSACEDWVKSLGSCNLASDPGCCNRVQRLMPLSSRASVKLLSFG